MGKFDNPNKKKLRHKKDNKKMESRNHKNGAYSEKPKE